MNHFQAAGDGVTFQVEGPTDAQITVELEADAEYRIYIDDADVGTMKTNLGGKLVLSVELENAAKASIKIEKMQ